MGDPLSVPEADIGAEPAPHDGADAEPLWLRLPVHLAPYFDLGFCHTDQTCPYVVLRARDDAQLGNAVEVGGPPEAFLELAEVIAAQRPVYRAPRLRRGALRSGITGCALWQSSTAV